MMHGLLTFCFALIIAFSTFAAEDKQLIPTASLIYPTPGFAVDTNGNMHVDPTLWQASGKDGAALYMGRGFTTRNLRASSGKDGLVVAMVADDMMEPDAGWKEVFVRAMLSGTPMPGLESAYSVSAISVDANHQVISQTQCLKGKCVTATPKSCQAFLTKSGAKDYGDLAQKSLACRSFNAAWDQTMSSATIGKDLDDAFAKDLARISKSPITSSPSKPWSGTMEFKQIKTGDEFMLRVLQSVFIETCRSHTQAGTFAGQGGTPGGTPGATPKPTATSAQ